MVSTNRNEADWRHQAATTLAQPFTDPKTGHAFQKGSNVTLMTVVRRGPGRLLALPVPNATAMFLNSSRVQFMRSEELLNDVKDTRDGVSILANHGIAFDLMESRAASVVFSFCALEAFANEMLPDEHTYRIDRKDGRCAEIYNKTQIERWLPLDTKLGAILPAVLSRSSPKGTSVWQAYKKLRDARDRVIHMKTADRTDAGPDDDTIWGTLIGIAPPHVTAKAMIDHFLSEQVIAPRWATLFPTS